MNRHTMLAVAAAATIAVATAAQARDQIRIVGSSTVFPFCHDGRGDSSANRPTSRLRWSKAPVPEAG